MIVVSNASPLLALAQADCLHILKALFGRVLMRAAVYRETVEQCPVPAQQRHIQSATDGFIAAAAPKIVYRFSRNLGQGESGAVWQTHEEFTVVGRGPGFRCAPSRLRACLAAEGSAQSTQALKTWTRAIVDLLS